VGEETAEEHEGEEEEEEEDEDEGSKLPGDVGLPGSGDDMG